jgi:Ser/Thr protein kinase RdoA (MazF antagonist)
MSAARPPLAGPLAHGMGHELVVADWPPLNEAEVNAVLARYGDIAAHNGDPGAAIVWRSPRPMSAAGLVRWRGGVVFVKRHDQRVRTAAQLAVEHALGDHLRARGVQVPVVRRTIAGETFVTSGDSVYEVHEVAGGVDLYRDAMSWEPFSTLAHARAAGAALARLHDAAAGFDQPPRAPGVLMGSCEIVTAQDPVGQVGRLLDQRPGLARYLARQHWQDDLDRYHLPVTRRAAPLLAALRPQWGHGDWHPSNLTWTSARADAEVEAVFDLGLANSTFAAHDVAIAVERSTVSWLDLEGTGRAEADLDAVDALLDGYEAVRPLGPAELSALAEVLPVVHLEYALSEIEYFADVVGSQSNADLAYSTYLVGHTRWFEGDDGLALITRLRQRAAAAARNQVMGA